MFKNSVFIFPGQGAQYAGMGKDMYNTHAIVRSSFEEAEDILKKNIVSVLLEGSQEELSKTIHSQVLIFVYSIALNRLIQEKIPSLKPSACAGLSLGEYSALVSSGKLSFAEGVALVEKRAQFMTRACQKTNGKMAVIMGLEASIVREIVQEANLPHDLWAANFNCPGQVVLSGTAKGIEKGTELAQLRGAKRVIPLQVEGAFHSGLMQMAQDKLTPEILAASFLETPTPIVMNFTGDFASTTSSIQKNLISQVTGSVLWEDSIKKLNSTNADLFLELGCGKTLSGMNRKIGITGKICNVDTLEDLEQLYAMIEE